MRSALLALCAALCACRPASSVTPMTVPEGFGSAIALRELPALHADDWRASPAVRRCETGVCSLDVRFDDPRAPARMNAWVIEPGATLQLPRDPSVDGLAMIVAGHAYAARAEDRAWDDEHHLNEQSRVGPWTALRSPGEGLMIYVSPSDPPVALVAVVARDMPESAATNAEPDAGAPASEPSRKPPKLRIVSAPRAELLVRPLQSIEWLSWGGGSFRAKIAFDGPQASRASLGVLVGGARASVSEHVHARSYELITAVIADGMVNVWGADDSPLGHQNVVRAGDPQVIPAGLRHAWVGAGTVPFVAVQAYAPGGPEQRFRALSR